MRGRRATGPIVQDDQVVVYLNLEDAMDLILMLPASDGFTRDLWRAHEELREKLGVPE